MMPGFKDGLRLAAASLCGSAGLFAQDLETVFPKIQRITKNSRPELSHVVVHPHHSRPPSPTCPDLKFVDDKSAAKKYLTFRTEKK